MISSENVRKISARNQITALGKGEDFPITNNDSAAGRQSNRRVELIFTESSAQIAADPGQ